MFKRWLAEQLEVPRRVYALWRARSQNPVIPAMRVRMGFGRTFGALILAEWLLFVAIVLGGALEASRDLRQVAAVFVGTGATGLFLGGPVLALVLFHSRRSGFDTTEELQDLHNTLLRPDEIAFGIFYPIARRYLFALLPPIVLLGWGGVLSNLAMPGADAIHLSVYLACAAVYMVSGIFLSSARVWLNPDRNFLRLVFSAAAGMATRAIVGWILGVAVTLGAYFVVALAATLLTTGETSEFTFRGAAQRNVTSMLMPFFTVWLVARDWRATALRAGRRILAPAAPEIHGSMVALLAESAAKPMLRGKSLFRFTFRRLWWRTAAAGIAAAAIAMVLGFATAFAAHAGLPLNVIESSDTYTTLDGEEGQSSWGSVLSLARGIILMPPGILLWILGALLLAHRFGVRPFVVSHAIMRGNADKCLVTALALIPGGALLVLALTFPLMEFRWRSWDNWLGVFALCTVPVLLASFMTGVWYSGLEASSSPRSWRRRALTYCLAGTAAVMLFQPKSERGLDESLQMLMFVGVVGALATILEWWMGSAPLMVQELHERYGAHRAPGEIIEIEE